jgi:hypothetical protein
MKHEMAHDLSQDLARKVAERAFASYREKYADFAPTLTWVSDTAAKASFSAKGVELKGTVELAPGKITLDLDVPFMLRMFQSKAVSIIERELTTWHERAKRGEIS